MWQRCVRQPAAPSSIGRYPHPVQPLFKETRTHFYITKSKSALMSMQITSRQIRRPRVNRQALHLHFVGFLRKTVTKCSSIHQFVFFQGSAY